MWGLVHCGSDARGLGALVRWVFLECKDRLWRATAIARYLVERTWTIVVFSSDEPRHECERRGTYRSRTAPQPSSGSSIRWAGGSSGFRSTTTIPSQAYARTKAVSKIGMNNDGETKDPESTVFFHLQIRSRSKTRLRCFREDIVFL